MRCLWCKNNLLAIKYHDTRWCKCIHNDKELFQMLVLETMSVGLSWNIVLGKEELIKSLCDDLDYNKCATYTDEFLDSLLKVDEMIKNKSKIYSIRSNAIAFKKVIEEYGSFDKYIWQFTDYKTIDHKLKEDDMLPASTELSIQVSKDLKKKGFKFLGPIMTYSYMQAIGIYNDHLINCSYR